MGSFEGLAIRALRTSERILPRRAAKEIGAWRANLEIARSPDRTVLTQEIFPALMRATGPDAALLWVGVRSYTNAYYRRLERAGAKVSTLDPDAARFGRAGRHVVGSLLALNLYFTASSFDVVMCNGVFGFGVDAFADQAQAMAAMAFACKPGGWLMLGWNSDRVDDPAANGVGADWFEPEAPRGLWRRKAIAGVTHVYDFFRRTARQAPPPPSDETPGR